ncbi:YdiU family protein [uncultured Gimesia sp.]|uniref:protein adenylyltransferase SelO n=1 Tax=uncultured Gimesia sp. TaxID=1678688 RepID=UPI0030D81B39|tara:strand:- start:5756 stop:7375 length:1620 start_codon:yes stop_codon:yes gene_type:complete
MNSQQTARNLDELQFDNQFTRALPADDETKNFRRQVSDACYSRVNPTQVARPQLVSYSKEVADLLDLESNAAESDTFAAVFAGNQVLEGMDPFAMCYGGHQFGNWAGQLGDGRAINLGEVQNNRGEHWALQLKGAGPTPYSRTADGLAVLRSSVREFLCSEAMYHLGVPTTRALSLVLTGEQVERDMFYDGNSKYEPGAVVCRVAPSFLRFGNYQIFASRGEIETLRTLVNFTIRNEFPHLGEPCRAVYLSWFTEVCRRTADMIVHWMRVGFVHGVMNTDNMSVLGLTIDYGPYGWLENYDPNWTPNTTDASGRRYRFGNQPQIALWNLVQLANALFPLIEDAAPLQQSLDAYVDHYEQSWQAMMAEKLGLSTFVPEADVTLIEELQEVLQLVETDMTIFFRKLSLLEVEGEPSADIDEAALLAPLVDAYYEPEKVVGEVRSKICAWLQRYRNRLRDEQSSDADRREKMNRVNPKYVLRNYLAQLAIDKAEQGDFTLVNELLELLRRPYDEQPDQEQYAKKRPDWARNRAGCSMLSCSS